jgi:D-alanine--poly(phosphoribitol) ligase subunit 2
MERRSKIVDLIRRIAKNNDLSVAPDESLFDSGLLDSFALTDLVNALEKEFALKIPDSDLNPRKFDTIERIESYLEERS